MKETGNPITQQGLLDTVQHNCTPETKQLILSEWGAIHDENRHSAEKCKKARMEWAMECWFTFNQPYSLIVQNLETRTYWLTESDDEDIETENSLNYADWTGRI